MINIDNVTINVQLPAQAKAEQTTAKSDASIALADLVMESNSVVREHWDVLPFELQQSIKRARLIVDA